MLDFTDPSYRRDPYPILKQVRDVDPIHKHAYGYWVVTRHADVRMVNRDPRFGRDLRRLRAGGTNVIYRTYPTLLESHHTAIFFLDPPDHTRIRRLVNYAFTPAAIAEMLAIVERTADELIGALPEEGPVELIGQVAKPFPVSVIGGILGVPEQDFPDLERWSFAIAEIVEPTMTRGQLIRAEQAATAFYEYLLAFVERRQREPGEGLVDRLIVAQRETEAITMPELIHNIMLIFAAGHETTTNLIGNGVYSLLQFPEQLARLRREPELLGRAVEEILRYESPANGTPRCAYEDIELGGKLIRKGELIMCMLGAANRDPQAFRDPDSLDIARDPNPHESFGGGPHYCIGAALARVEGRVALAKLLARYSHIELDPSRLTWANRINLRGLSQLGLFVRR
jgi:cytochrome P450